MRHSSERRSFGLTPACRSSSSAGCWSGSARGSAAAAPAATASAASRASRHAHWSRHACSWRRDLSRSFSPDTSWEDDQMRRVFSAFASGLLFGLGLTVSHMIDPAKVLGFLDLAGDWDPSLALVMLGALAVAAPGYALARRLSRPLCAADFGPPTRTEVDRRLMVGAMLFGTGWGLVGYC